MTTRLFRRGVSIAPLVFAVSEDTKRELVRRFGMDADHVLVTHEGGDPVLASMDGDIRMERKRDAEERIRAAEIEHSFILALGTVEPRKNLAMLVRAWNAARPAFPHPVDLVIAGRDGWKSSDVRDAIRSSLDMVTGKRDIHRIATLDDEVRRDLLLAADIIAVPSLHEGFGLVALEAMQAGTALLASCAGAIPEVVGDEGILLDPTDAHAWTDAMVRLVSDDESRAGLGRHGASRSRGFAWDRTADIVIEGLKRHFLRT
jgi:alpha-1,3-rhamnosyl/mannosyltransferase